MARSIVVSLSIDSTFLKIIDNFIKEMGYTSRSELFRDAIRRLIEEHRLISTSQKILASIIVIYRSGEQSPENRLAKVRHQFSDIVISNLHVHVDERYCSEFVLAKGRSKRINELVVAIRGIKGIESINYAFVPL